MIVGYCSSSDIDESDGGNMSTAEEDATLFHSQSIQKEDYGPVSEGAPSDAAEDSEGVLSDSVHFSHRKDGST